MILYKLNCVHLLVYMNDSNFSTLYMLNMRFAGNSNIHVICLQGLIQNV
jgi:hypothetical protein